MSLSELGTRLKTAREELGYTLDELQSITKIQKRYLLAIEEGDFSRLPGDFYARAFVKSYADAVGLNSDVLFEEYRDELPQIQQDQVELPPRMTRSKPRTVRKKSRFTSFLPTIVVVLFLIAIAGFLWYSGQDNQNDRTGISRNELQNDPDIDNSITIPDEVNDNDEEDNLAEGETNEEKEQMEEEIPEQKPTLEYVNTEGTNSYYTLTNADQFNVTMKFTGPSWVRILDANEARLHERTYQTGDEATFDFSDHSEITFHLGSALTTEIYINEELIDYPIDSTVQYIIVEFQSE